MGHFVSLLALLAVLNYTGSKVTIGLEIAEDVNGSEVEISFRIPDFPCGHENTDVEVEKISRSKVCNGMYADCKNSADETFEVCSQLRCPPNFFQCEYGACIRHTLFCDGFDNCIDGSDEAYCGRVVGSCDYQEYYCKSGKCIGAEAVCNGRVDCDDGSDESDEVCVGHLCPNHSFQCIYGGCISSEAICNGVADCRDQSDELSSLCRGNCSTGVTLQGSRKCVEGCKENEFRCSSGTCISKRNICDGVIDCIGDGYDEAPVTCSNFHCSPYAFRCSNGACIKATQACDGVFDCADGSDENLDLCKERRPMKSCIIPSFPVNGRHSFENRANMLHLQVAHFSCNPGFELKGFNVTYCFDGTWIPSTSPTCEPRVHCPALNSRLLDLECFLSSGTSHPCNLPAPEGTVAKYSCHQYYILKKDYPNNESLCQNGVWSKMLPECRPDCGKPVVHPRPLTLPGTTTTYGEWPWQAALYVHKGGSDGVPSNWSFECGGSLVTENIVITAAHCVWRARLNAILAAFGKYFREYGHQEKLTQIRELKEIIMHPAYYDYSGNYNADIALLVLASPVIFTSVTLPVCLNRVMQHNYDLSTQSIGTMVGYGSASDVLMKIDLPVNSFKQCVDEIPWSCKKYIRSSTFCAGFQNRIGICNGDGGSGLMLKQNDGSWVIKGIVNVLPGSLEGKCHLSKYAIFTKIESYIEWVMTNIEENVLTQ